MSEEPAAPQSVPPDSHPPPKETRIRECPHCRSKEVAPVGRVTTTQAAIRVDFRGHDCSTGFVLLR